MQALVCDYLNIIITASVNFNSPYVHLNKYIRLLEKIILFK